MKILMVVSRLNVGGTENYILSISQQLKALGIRIGIAARSGPLEASYKNLGIPVYNLTSKSGSQMNAAAVLSSIIDKEKYQIIHAHDSNSFRYAAQLYKLRKFPMIITVLGTYHNRAALLAASQSARSIITISPNLTKWLTARSIPANKITLVPNGIRTSTFRPSLQKEMWRKKLGLPLNAQIMAHVSRFAPDKFPTSRKVVLAAEQIAKQNRNFIAVFVGPGSLRLQLEKAANEVNTRLGRKAIYVRPPMIQIQQMYHAADFVIGTGRVALEAMACAKPLIAAGVSGYIGIVEPKSINLAIDCNFGDHGSRMLTSVQLLTADINKILANKSWALTLGKFGRSVVTKRFSIETVTSKLVQVYKRYLNK